MTEEQKRARAERCRQMGTLGGQATAQRYGREYMRAIGAEGFQAYADKHHGGNRAAALASIKIMHSPNVRVPQPKGR